LSTKNPQVTLSSDVAGKNIKWQGILVRDEAILDSKSRVIYGVVVVNDPYQLEVPAESKGIPLRFGRFVNATIIGITANDIIVLPRNVLRLDGTILTVNDDRKININFVTVQRADEDFVYISEGLSAQQHVIMSAVPNPYEGMPVRFLDDEIPSKNQLESSVNNNAAEVK
jgi:hypothetical protein